MAATLVEETILDIGQGLALVLGTIKGDASYPTNGYPVDAPGDLGYRKLAPSGATGGYQWSWDKTNQKVIAYRQSAATGALTETAAAVDLSAVTFDFIAIRPK